MNPLFTIYTSPLRCDLRWETEVSSCIHSRFPSSFELSLDVHETIVLRYPFAAARRTGFQMASAKTDSDVGNEVICRLTRPVRDEYAPSKAVRQLRSRLSVHDEYRVQASEEKNSRLNGLADSTNLVHLQQHRVARRPLLGKAHPLNIRAQ